MLLLFGSEEFSGGHARVFGEGRSELAWLFAPGRYLVKHLASSPRARREAHRPAGATRSQKNRCFRPENFFFFALRHLNFPRAYLKNRNIFQIRS
jgi:hypothetical protein